jgi:RNA polymerase sigma factor (sigma-70 family)
MALLRRRPGNRFPQLPTHERPAPITSTREPNRPRLRRQGMRRAGAPDLVAVASARRTEPSGGERWNSVTTVAMDDAELAERFASGDADTVRVVYQTHGRLVFAVAYKVLGDRGLAEEATQQTFVKAWRAAGTYDPTRSLAAWLTTIARNVAIDTHRRERRHRNVATLESVASELVTLPPSAEQIHDVLEVRQALDELPDQDRELIRLQHYDELTHTEIADHLAIPLGTVKSRSFRAHRRLAGLLGHLRAEPDDTTEGGSHG